MTDPLPARLRASHAAHPYSYESDLNLEAATKIERLVKALEPDILVIAAEACDRAGTKEMGEVAAELRAKAKHEKAALGPETKTLPCPRCQVPIEVEDDEETLDNCLDQDGCRDPECPLQEGNR